MKSNNKILLAIAAGAVVGGLLGVLFAPEKGVETRNRLRSKGKKFAGQAEDLFAGVKNKISGLTSRGNDNEPVRSTEQIFE